MNRLVHQGNTQHVRHGRQVTSEIEKRVYGLPVSVRLSSLNHKILISTEAEERLNAMRPFRHVKDAPPLVESAMVPTGTDTRSHMIAKRRGQVPRSLRLSKTQH